MSTAIDALTNSLDNFVQQNPVWADYINSFKSNYRSFTIEQLIQHDCGGCVQLENFRDFFIIIQYHMEAPQGEKYLNLADIFTKFVLTVPEDVETNVLPFLTILYLGALSKEIESIDKLHKLKSWIELYSKLTEFSKNNQNKPDLTQFKENLSLQISFRTWDLVGDQLEESKISELLEAIDVLAFSQMFDLDVDSSISNFFSFICGGLVSKFNVYFASEQEKQGMNLNFGKRIVTCLKKLRLDEYNQEQFNRLVEFFGYFEEEIESDQEEVIFIRDPNLPYMQFDISKYVYQKIVYASTANPKVNVTIYHYKNSEGLDIALKEYTANQTVEDIVKVKLEIDILETLSNISTPHNCFLKFYGSSWNGLKVYLSMEYHPQTLMQYISELKRNNHKFTEEHLIFYTRQLCDGFSAMEQLGIYHQDIKPHNILITNDLYLKIIDFSISCVRTQADATVAATGMHLIQGTSGYMAPELEDNLRNPSRTAKFRRNKADVFSLGMTLLQLWTFEELHTLNLRENNSRLMDKVRSINIEWFKTLLFKMLTLNYNDRISFRETLKFIPADKTTFAG